MVRCFSLSAVRPVQGPLYSFKTLCILSSDVGGARVTQPTLGNTAREMDFQSIIRGCDSQDIEKRCRNANSATSEPLFVKWGDLLRSLRSPDHWWLVTMSDAGASSGIRGRPLTSGTGACDPPCPVSQDTAVCEYANQDWCKCSSPFTKLEFSFPVLLELMYTVYCCFSNFHLYLLHSLKWFN